MERAVTTCSGRPRAGDRTRHRQSDHDQLHGHGGDERDDVLLRGGGGEHGRGECELQPGECDPGGGQHTDQLQRRVQRYRVAVEWQCKAERNAAAVDQWGENEAGSAFYTTPVNVQSFTTNFSFQMTSATADGMTFVIQNGAATALGGSGGDWGMPE